LGKEDFRLYACAARVELTIPGAVTLKDRRAVVKSILERIRSRFNVSAADLDGGERGASRAVLGIAAASNSREHAGETIQKVVEFIAGDGRAEMGNVDIYEI
jgi:uncharacterized protein YlxP (DUF503 family)